MKSKIIDISQAIILISMLLFGVVYAIILGFNELSFYVTIALFSVSCFINLFYIILRLSIVPGYDFKKYTPYLHASYLIGSILMYYGLKNLGHFSEYYYVYWILLLGINSICIIVFLWLNKNAKDDKPKIIANKH